MRGNVIHAGNVIYEGDVIYGNGPGAVGWVERSETHRFTATMMGFASLNPS